MRWVCKHGRPWLAAALCALQPLTSLAADPPQEYTDEQTAATITIVAQPLVFAYARRELAANARDYATVAAAAVNRSGKISYVLIVYFWTTVDPRLRDTGNPDAEPVVILADDRRISLKLQSHSARDAGIGTPVHAPPGDDVPPNVYAIDLATTRFISESRHLALQADSGGTSFTYDLWEDRRGALRAFVHHMNGED
ncbi:MAG TPA: hypothetical protein VIE42_07295 [Steroidobacteraceae bacterium]